MDPLEQLKKDNSCLKEQIMFLLKYCLAATSWSPNHTTVTNNKYQKGTLVWFEDYVYECLVSNNSIPVNNEYYWHKINLGHLLAQEVPIPTTPGPGIYSFISPLIEEDEVVSILQAAIDQDGYLSAIDWETFNNKQDALPTGGTPTQYLNGDLVWVEFPSFPSLPTKTSDLTNDGSDGIHPFITLEDLPPLPPTILSALPFTTDHLATTNNQYAIGDVVYYLGDVYRCIANNDSIVPTATSYWTNIGAGYPIVQQPGDWNSTSGNNQILNKPTIPTVGTWGALNYPAWTSGTPFVKMTAAGVFTLDTSTYLTGITSSDVTTALGYTPVTNARTLTINGVTYDLTADRIWTIAVGSGTVTSVGLTVPSAFSVTPSTITTSGTFAITGAGNANQYVRGDGTLATLPSNASGGSAVSYYLNGGTAASVATYYQMSKIAVVGTGVDFSKAGNGLISQWLTDVADPNRLEIPAGNWNFEMYMSASSSGGTPAFYVELLKYNGTTFTTIANSSAAPEAITGGTLIDLYLTSLAIPQTVLLATDRLAVRVYIVNSTEGRTITMHTQDSHLCEIITNFAGGISALNGLTANTQYLAVGTSGTDFNIQSTVDTHTFNLPTASATNRGALSTTDWTNFNTAYTDRLKWDGGATGLVAATGRTSLGANTVGSNLFTLANPSAITFIQINADNSISTLDASTFRTAIGAGTSITNGTVTSVAALTLGTTGTDLTSTVANGTTTPVITLNVPDASATARGVITTGTQTIAGEKTFTDGIKIGVNTRIFEFGASTFINNLTAGYTFYVGGGPTFQQNNLSVPNGTFNIALQTASTIASFDANKNVVSLDTTIYPNLTELTTVRGVTSAIQTQINAVNVNVITITTAVSITTDTTSGGYSQHGRHIKINNGANNINIECVSTSNADFVASYEKIGAGSITFTFVTGSTTVVQLSGTNQITGTAAVGSKACLSRNGSIYYLQITNY